MATHTAPKHPLIARRRSLPDFVRRERKTKKRTSPLTHLSTSMPDFDAITPLSSASDIPSSSPRSLADDAPDPHDIFRLRGMVMVLQSLLRRATKWSCKASSKTVFRRCEVFTYATYVRVVCPPRLKQKTRYISFVWRRHSKHQTSVSDLCFNRDSSTFLQEGTPRASLAAELG